MVIYLDLPFSGLRKLTNPGTEALISRKSDMGDRFGSCNVPAELTD